MALALSATFLSSQGQSVNEFFQQAKNDLEQQNLDAAFAKLQKIDSTRPNHPVVVNYLLDISCQKQNTENALLYLRKTILMKADTSLAGKAGLEFLQGNAAFEDLKLLARQLTTPLSNSDSAFLLPDKLLHPEGIAYDSRSKRFFVSSIHQRKIVQVDDKGRASDFCAAPVLWAVSGLVVDTKQKVLWATSCAIAEMERFDQNDEGSCKLVRVGLETGQIIESFLIDRSVPHHWGDLILDKKGNVYISDSAQPVIYILRKGAKKIEEFTRSEEWLNLQGICFSSDEKYMFVSDYIKGLYRLETANPQHISPITVPENFIAKGIDGLYFHNNSLITIQNGVQPFRLARLSLNKDKSLAEAASYLELGTAHLGEPTLGTIVNGELYFVANSPWGYYEDGQLKAENVPQPLVMKISLD